MAPIHTTRHVVRLCICRHAELAVGRWLKPALRLCLLALCLSIGADNAGGGDLTGQTDTAGQELAAKLTTESQADKAEAVSWAGRHGFPIRFDDGRLICEMMAVRDDRPVYYMTDNVNAATSVATDRVRDVSFWQLDGSGVTVGLWDEAGVRATHQEFQKPGGGSRIQLGNTLAQSGHTTHVAGTIGAQGIDPAAKGMAPACKIMSFNWNSDAAQMAATTAYKQGQPDGIYVSNHSYGYLGGWVYLSDTSATGHVGWHWTADWAGAGSRDDWFGYYHTIASQWDTVAYTKNYYLAFAAAGNDRLDNPPVGATVYYYDGIRWQVIAYDPSTCAPGDGIAAGGYNTLCGPMVAKDIMTVGAVGDAVAHGARSLTDANMAQWSSWGPTNDGRIKPDIVANGVNVYSTWSGTDDRYGTVSGTSMATPNATGSAALLVQLYGRLFPGMSMRASTLKGVIIHTADDLGRPGPDYSSGWGLMNVRAAADLIQKQHDSSSGNLIVEGRLTSNYLSTNNPDDSYYFRCDGTEPIRITLCWTDPAGPSLVHDMDLRITSQDGSTTYYPYVLNPGKPSVIATRGDNHIDNVEQVYVGGSPEPGVYTVIVNYKQTLARGEQYYSLVSSIPLTSVKPPVVNDATPSGSGGTPRPPTALDSRVYVCADVPMPFHLEATDDGPLSLLSFAVLSPPTHGSLQYSGGAGRVVYVPQAGFVGDDAFTFCANDGGTQPSGGASNTATVTLRVRHMITREYQVITDKDDAFGGDGDPTVFSETLSVGQYDGAMRFQNVDVPRAGEVVSSRLKLCMDTTSIEKATGGVLYAEAAGDANDFNRPGLRLRQLPRTQESVPWPWQAGSTWPLQTFCPGPDMSQVVQEIVSRDDWSSGNALAILYAGDITSGQNLRFFGCGEAFAGKAPKLQVTYTLAPDTDWLQPEANPPLARDYQVEAISNQPLTITLAASDDGLPDPPGKLTSTILSLPNHGTLATLSGSPIAAGQSLANFKKQVVYRSSPGFHGDDSFTFCADDGGTYPSGGTSNTGTVQVSVLQEITADFPILAGADDAQVYRATKSQSFTTQTLSIGAYIQALRFQNIPISQGAEIKEATLRICSASQGLADATWIYVYAEATDNAGDFSNRPILAMKKTSASSKYWSLDAPWTADTWYDSPSIRAVIQEVINRPGWATGNSIALIMSNDWDYTSERKFLAYESDPAKAARLRITYRAK